MDLFQTWILPSATLPNPFLPLRRQLQSHLRPPGRLADGAILMKCPMGVGVVLCEAPLLVYVSSAAPLLASLRFPRARHGLHDRQLEGDV